MIPRYSRPEMAAVWDPKNKFQKWMERSEKAVVLKRYGRHTRDIMSDLRGFQNKDQNTIPTETALVKSENG